MLKDPAETDCLTISLLHACCAVSGQVTMLLTTLPCAGPAWNTAQQGAPAQGTRAGQSLVWDVAQMSAPHMGSNLVLNSMSYREMEAEYVRQRQAVLEELRVAKTEAEAERAKIMARINSTLGNMGRSRWGR